MAWIYERPNSPYYWCGWNNPKTGKTVRESTGVFIGGLANRRKANAHKARRALEENTTSSNARFDDGLFALWVRPFLQIRYKESPLTLQRYESSWTAFEEYFEEKGIEHPAQVTRQHCLDFLPWRKAQRHGNLSTGEYASKKKKTLSHNTVLLELKLLGLVMHEAVVRGYITGNPALKLGIKRAPARVKSEMTDWHIETIEARIQEIIANPKTKELGEFFFTTFMIAKLIGCRMRETGFHKSQVDWTHLTYEVTVKGNKTHVFAINPDLVPFLQELFKTQDHTWNVRPKFNPRLEWFYFFDHLRKVHPGAFDRVSFHSTRVTWTSRMERGGLAESVAQSQMAHSSTTVHRTYRRVKPSELAPYWRALRRQPSALPPPPAHTTQTGSAPQNPDCPPTTSTQTPPSPGV